MINGGKLAESKDKNLKARHPREAGPIMKNIMSAHYRPRTKLGHKKLLLQNFNSPSELKF
jgi:hypothetical protein